METAGDYDAYEEGLIDHVWTMGNGATIKVKDMRKSHLINTIGLVNRTRWVASSEDEIQKWDEWLDILNDELVSRPAKSPTKSPTKSRGTTRQMKCHCGKEYDARTADLNRGWALSCNKRCAAIRREFGRPAAIPVNLEISL